MLFNSIDFLIFFPLVTVLYFVFPRRVKPYWLLAASYYFYMCWNAKYALLILLSTAVTYASGRVLERQKRAAAPARRKKWTVAASFVVNLGILFAFKYLNFALTALRDALAVCHIALTVPAFDFLLPVGISFYTFQALGYTVDVYRGDVTAERNFFRYALFVSFFPQLVAGPIERSKNLLGQLETPQKFCFETARDGFLQMLWGFFLKLVLADRIGLFVDTVYADPAAYPGVYLIVATVLFAVQIYCDFYGYSTIAMGAAQILGIRLMENFDAPYLAGSVSDFWRRWHISLTSWFKDYLYIPLGGSRKGTARKYLNKMIVFLVSGLWHGARISFVVWGGLNGLYQVAGEWLKPVRDKAVACLHLDRRSLGHRLLCVGFTFVLTDIAWVFFRAEGFREALTVFRQMGVYNPWVLFDGSLYRCGLDAGHFTVVLIGLGILLFADICKRRHIVIRRVIQRQNGWFRWAFIALAIGGILLFGVWGPAFDAANFIYFQF